jgi:hypothetical protein
MVVAESTIGDRNHVRKHVPRRCSLAIYRLRVIEGSRKQDLDLQMRKLTLNMMAWSTTPIADGDSVAISGDVLQKGSMQLG